MSDKRYLKKQMLYFLYRGAMWVLWLLTFISLYQFMGRHTEMLYSGYSAMIEFLRFIVIVIADFILMHSIYRFIEKRILRKRSFRNYFRDFLI